MTMGLAPTIRAGQEGSELLAGLAKELEQRRNGPLFRERRMLQGCDGTTAWWRGRRVELFCSNDYLGLANHPKVVEAMVTAAKEQGVGAGAAHLVTGHRPEHHALEEELAAFTGRQRALLFSTGYMANLGVLSTLGGRGRRVYQDRLNHASLLDGVRCAGGRLLRYPHRDMAVLARMLAQRSASASGAEASGAEASGAEASGAEGVGAEQAPAIVATDGVFSMDGDRAPLTELAALSARHGAWLVVDDAHGFGVLGPNGRGSVAEQGLDSVEVPVMMGTLGKAVGTFGAFVAADEVVIEALIQRARSYIYTTAVPPAVAAATRAALALVRDGDGLRQRLRARVMRFVSGARQLGLSLPGDPDMPVQPVILGTAARATEVAGRLLEQGMVVTAIRPPTVPEGTARLRVTLSAAHTEEQVDRLLEALNSVIGDSVIGNSMIGNDTRVIGNDDEQFATP